MTTRGDSCRQTPADTLQIHQDTEAGALALGIALTRPAAECRELLDRIPPDGLTGDLRRVLTAAREHLLHADTVDELTIAEAARAAGAENIGVGYITGLQDRSEERRVGKECRSRGWPYD